MKHRKLILPVVIISVLAIILLLWFNISSRSEKYTKIILKKNTDKIFSSNESNDLAVIIDGKLYIYDHSGEKQTVDLDFNVESIEFTDEKMLLISDMSELYEYNIKEKSVSDIILKKCIDCSIHGNSYAAISEKGQLYVWGENQNNIFGNEYKESDKPRLVDYVNNAKEIQIGSERSVYSDNDGYLYECGLYDYSDKDGNAEFIDKYRRIDDIKNTKKFYVRNNETLCVTENNDIFYWERGYGACDINEKNPTRDSCAEIIKYCKKYGLTEFAAGNSFFLAKNNNGELYIWGADIVNKPECKCEYHYAFEPRKVGEVDNVDDFYAGSDAAYVKNGNEIIILSDFV